MSSRRGGSGVSIHIKNLPATLSDDELKQKFERFGRILDVYMPRHRRSNQKKGYAFIEFENKESADDAIAALHNTVIDGRTIVCELAQEKRKTPAEMMEIARSERQGSTTENNRRSPSRRQRRRRSSDRTRERSPAADRRRRRNSVDSNDRRRTRRRSRSPGDRRRSRSPRRRSGSRS